MNILDQVKKVLDATPACSPPWWAPEGHLQTMVASLIPVPQLPPMEQFLLPLENESEKLHISYLQGSSSLCLYLFHGLGGSIDSPYMKRFTILAQKWGHHVYLTNHRGCGAGEGLARSGYHSGRSEDLSRAIALGRERHPEATHVAIGVSLSANALLLLSAGIRAQVLPDLAIAINAPIDLEKSAITLKAGLNRIYDRHFLKSLKKYLLGNHKESMTDYHLLESLHDFDDRYTAPLAGYKNREEYYELCSAKQYLPLIKIPTLIIASADDPFIEISDYLNASYSPSTLVRLEKSGGHLGYLRGQGMGYAYWLDELMGRIYEAL